MNLILVCSLAQRWWFRLPVFVSYTCCHLRWTKCLPLSLPYVCNQKESERVTQLVLNISHNCDKILPCLFWSVPNPTHQLMMAHISKISHSSPPHFTPTLHPHTSPPLFTPTLHPHTSPTLPSQDHFNQLCDCTHAVHCMTPQWCNWYQTCDEKRLTLQENIATHSIQEAMCNLWLKGTEVKKNGLHCCRGRMWLIKSMMVISVCQCLPQQ